MFEWLWMVFDGIFMVIIEACNYNIFFSSMAIMWLIFSCILMSLLVIEVSAGFAKWFLSKVLHIRIEREVESD